MKISRIDKKIGVLVLGLAVLLTACVVPNEEDPFERIEDEQVEVLSGVVHPFSIASVSTRVTHRLEKDARLVTYLASDVVRLEDFEGREIEVEGVFRQEKMRQIFWVDEIKVLDLPIELIEEESLYKRYGEGKFTFEYPSNWNYSEAPDGRVYFNSKDDVNGTVFFTFQPRKKQADITTDDVNVFVQSLTGKRNIETTETGAEKDEVRLLSNLYDAEYKFAFTRDAGDSEMKKIFQKLLNSFVEGEDVVEKIVSDEKKAKADREALRLKQYGIDITDLVVTEKVTLKNDLGEDPELSEVADLIKDQSYVDENRIDEVLVSKDSNGVFTLTVPVVLEQREVDLLEPTGALIATYDITRIEEPTIEKTEVVEEEVEELVERETEEPIEVEEEETPEVEIVEEPAVEVIEDEIKHLDEMHGVIEEGAPFENQISTKSHNYESGHLGFSMKVPHLYYFRNFGKSTGEIAQLGFSISGDPSPETAEFLMTIVPAEGGIDSIEETIIERSLIVEVPRNDSTIFRFTGQVEDRDNILSVVHSIQQF